MLDPLNQRVQAFIQWICVPGVTYEWDWNPSPCYEADRVAMMETGQCLRSMEARKLYNRGEYFGRREMPARNELYGAEGRVRGGRGEC